MKHKIGDKIKIKEGLKIGSSYSGYIFEEHMKKYEGKCFTVNSIGFSALYVMLDTDIFEIKNCAWTEHMIEPITAEDKLILFTKIANHVDSDKIVTIMGNVFETQDEKEQLECVNEVWKVMYKSYKENRLGDVFSNNRLDEVKPLIQELIKMMPMLGKNNEI